MWSIYRRRSAGRRGESGGAEDTRPVAEARVLDRERAARELRGPHEDAARDAVEELGQRLEETAAEDQNAGVEQRHVIGDGEREEPRGVRPETARELVAGVGGGRHHRRVEGVGIVFRELAEPRLHAGGRGIAKPPPEARARHVLLETAVATARAGQTLGHDLRVAEFARGVAGAAPERAVEHRARAHAGAHEDGEQRAHLTVRAEAKLAPRRRVDVVLDAHGDAERGGQGGRERNPAPAEIRGVHDGAGGGVDLAGARDADGREVVHSLGEAGDGAADGFQDGGRAALRLGEGFGLRGEPPVDRDGPRADAGASEVDADDGGYAFFSSSLRAGVVVSSAFASLTPFLNSFTLEPRERASSGRR